MENDDFDTDFEPGLEIICNIIYMLLLEYHMITKVNEEECGLD